MAQYRFLAADVLTNQVWAELPLRNSSFGWKLNDSGSFAGELLLTDPRMQQIDWDDGTSPGRTALYVERDGIIIWGGIIWLRRYNFATKTLQITGNDFWSYFLSYRTAYNNANSNGWNYVNQDMLFICQDQVNYAQSFPNGNIGVLVPATTSGVVINASIQNTQLTSVGQVVQNIATGTSLNTGTAARTVTDGVTNGTATVTSATANFTTADLGTNIGGGSIPIGSRIGTLNSPTSINLAIPAVSGTSASGVTINIGQAPVQSAGFDFAIDVDYDTNRNFRKTLNLSYPRRGRTQAQNALAIDLPTQALDYTWVMNTPENIMRATGQGTGSTELFSGQAAPNIGAYPLLSVILQSSTAVNQPTLDGRAEAWLDAVENGPTTPTVTVQGDSPGFPFGSYTVGDTIRLTAVDEHFAGLDLNQRLVDIVLHPGDDGMDTVDLSFNNMPTFA